MSRPLLSETHMWRADLPACQPALDELLRRFDVVVRAHRVPPVVRRELHLVLDEVVENVIMHGSERSIPHVWVVVSVSTRRARLLISDNGRRFNPLAARAQAGSSADRIGGVGLLLMRGLMDRVTYTWRDGRNWLRATRVLVRPVRETGAPAPPQAVYPGGTTRISSDRRRRS